MKHRCKITVLRKECFEDLQQQYLADPHSGPCPYFEVGQEFILEQDDFFRLLHGRFCAEAWDAISRYVYAALQGGSIMEGWTNDEKIMIACCNDGTRPVVFKIERLDEETAQELAQQGTFFARGADPNSELCLWQRLRNPRRQCRRGFTGLVKRAGKADQ